MSTETKCDICFERSAKFNLTTANAGVAGHPGPEHLCEACLDTYRVEYLGWHVEHMASGEAYDIPERMLI